MDWGGGHWIILAIIVPIVLVLAWAMMHNRSSRREKRHTEEATRRMYDTQGARDEMREGD